MAGILESVNLGTQSVWNNRLDLLLFKLAGSQRSAINVVNARDVMPCPLLTAIPKRNKNGDMPINREG
jgi:two-component system, chemotaxis family, chemotaxis protein CheV